MTTWVMGEAEVLLRSAGYSTLMLVDPPSLAFEDEEIFGFVCVYDSPQALVENWLATQNSLLVRFAAALRNAEKKAWNVYMVVLCEPAADEPSAFQLDRIESDLVHTRKIARASMRSSADLRAAMAPLLPLQNDPKLGSERLDERIQQKLKLELGDAATAVLFGTADPRTAAQAVVESLT